MTTSKERKQALIKRWTDRKKCDREEATRLAIEELREDAKVSFSACHVIIEPKRLILQAYSAHAMKFIQLLQQYPGKSGTSLDVRMLLSRKMQKLPALSGK